MNNELQITPVENILLDNAQKVFDLLDVSPMTRDDYKRSIKVFIAFMKERTLDYNSFLAFKQHLKSRIEISVSTKNKYLISARILLKELHRLGQIPFDITNNIKGFNQGRKHKREGVNETEVQHLCEKIKLLPPNFYNLRLKAILSLLIFQGFRQMEIVGLNVDDVDFVVRTARIIGKGKDDYEVIHLHPEAVKSLREYMSGCKIADGALFFSHSNNGKNTRLTTRSLRRIVKSTFKVSGIDKCTHGFRHYFTTKLLETFKGDLLRVAELTRHKTLDMLQVYNDSRMTIENLPKYYSAFSGTSFS